jgi:uncharacterized membrane protein YhaH (DUF805 family)
MAGILSAQNFRFLFREDKGSIDRRTWWVAMAALAIAWIIVALLSAAVTLLAEYAGQETVSVLAALTRGVYLSAVFNILIILVYVCYYYVSAKRYNDLGLSPVRALILPAAIYVLTLSPSLTDPILPVYGRWIMQVLFLGVAAWQVYVLGFVKGRL